MKKFLIIALAAAVCIGFSELAMADVKVGGRISFDTYMQSFDANYKGKSALDPAITDFSELNFENNSSTNLHVKWTEADFGMYLELAMGSNNEQNILQATQGTLEPVDNVFTRYSYGWWDFGAGKLTVGQDNTGFSPLNPMQMCGTGSGQFKIIGIGFGNIYSGRVYQLRGNFDLGETGSLGVALVDPHGSSLAQGLYFTDTGGAHPYWGYQITPAGSEETTMPRIDISAVLKFAGVRLYPGLLYQKITWDDVPAGADDEITTTLYSVGAKTSFGAFGIAAEYNMGQNPGNANLLTDGTYFKYGSRPSALAPAALTGLYGTGFDMAAVVDSSGKVSDTDFTGYWVDLSYKFGHNTFHAIYGQQHIENDKVPYLFTGTDLKMKNTRTMMSFNVWIPLSKNLIVIPEVNFWDYGDREIEGQADAGLGEATIYGINWLFMF